MLILTAARRSPVKDTSRMMLLIFTSSEASLLSWLTNVSLTGMLVAVYWLFFLLTVVSIISLPVILVVDQSCEFDSNILPSHRCGWSHFLLLSYYGLPIFSTFQLRYQGCQNSNGLSEVTI
ncbi:Uncharacterized protein Fot_55221 [Forsythia ovata]|uniref:Uncharacterized protein n=1 Tax=Forsythia ovata TaxID=205694 RepID=A0ABD1P4Z0_9LAMI